MSSETPPLVVFKTRPPAVSSVLLTYFSSLKVTAFHLTKKVPLLNPQRHLLTIQLAWPKENGVSSIIQERTPTKSLFFSFLTLFSASIVRLCIGDTRESVRRANDLLLEPPILLLTLSSGGDTGNSILLAQHNTFLAFLLTRSIIVSRLNSPLNV